MGCVESFMRGPETESYDDSIATFQKLQISKSSVEKLKKIFNKIVLTDQVKLIMQNL